MPTCPHGNLYDGCVYCAIGSSSNADALEAANYSIFMMEIAKYDVIKWKVESMKGQLDRMGGALVAIDTYHKDHPSMHGCKHCIAVNHILATAVEDCRKIVEKGP
jgi:hypothetical protein